MWGASSRVGNDSEVWVGQHERAGKGPAARGAWEWRGRCPSLMQGARWRQVPFVSCFQLGRHAWGAGPALHEDRGEGERQASAPSRAAESRCLERRRREGRVDMGGLPGAKSSWELLERRRVARVGGLTS